MQKNRILISITALVLLQPCGSVVSAKTAAAVNVQQAAAPIISQAKSAFDKKEYAHCTDLCNTFLKEKSDPIDHAQALALRSWAKVEEQVSKGDHNRFPALGYLQFDLAHAVEQAPNDLLVRNARLAVANFAHKHAVVIEDATKLIQLNPKDGAAYLARARANEHRQNYAEALKDFRKAQTLEAADAATLAHEMAECRKELTHYNRHKNGHR